MAEVKPTTSVHDKAQNQEETKPQVSMSNHSAKTNTAYIGIGANLDNPRQHVTQAFDDLAQIIDTQLKVRSSLYQSTPLGPSDQPDYINAVAQLTTGLSPIELLKSLQNIENQHGRIRKNQRWGPRTLDLDLLLYNNDVLSSKELTLPHYAMHERNFVLFPLYEISPSLVLPNGDKLESLVEVMNKQGIEKLC
jgi:2-amino-4-hydroxy-6-hydroxymethyldihydropteridine diphosphokinase